MKTPSDYSPDEQAHFRKAFAAVAARYRRRSRRALLPFAGLVACLLAAFALETAPKRLWACAVLCWVAFMAVLLTIPELHCPACGNALARGLGRYCPTCGAGDRLQPGRWIRVTTCGACGKALPRRRRKGRPAYRIRACTHCGLSLDEKGL